MNVNEDLITSKLNTFDKTPYGSAIRNALYIISKTLYDTINGIANDISDLKKTMTERLVNIDQYIRHMNNMENQLDPTSETSIAYKSHDLLNQMEELYSKITPTVKKIIYDDGSVLYYIEE